MDDQLETNVLPIHLFINSICHRLIAFFTALHASYTQRKFLSRTRRLRRSGVAAFGSSHAQDTSHVFQRRVQLLPLQSFRTESILKRWTYMPLLLKMLGWLACFFYVETSYD